MSHSKLLLPELEHHSRSGATPAEESARKRGGPGNRDLLAAMGAGKAMPGPVQAKMEKSLGADFSQVRLYESPLVDQAGAQAAASGSHVAFAPGKLDFNSPAGLELLGHELSHVASQARGEVSGRGLVQDAGLEHRADLDGAKAMHAFDPVSGGDLTPMSAGPAPACPAGPIQAKKKKQTPGDRLLEGLSDLNLQQQVKALHEISIVSSNLPDFDQSEQDAYYDVLGTLSPDPYADEMLRQYVTSAHALVNYRDNYTGSGGDTDADEKTFMAKYSPAARNFQGYSTLAANIARGTSNMGFFDAYTQRLGALKEQDPDAHAVIEAAQSIVLDTEQKNSWVQSPTGGAALGPDGISRAQAIREASADQTEAFSRNWKRPEKRGFFRRLFHMKNPFRG